MFEASKKKKNEEEEEEDDKEKDKEKEDKEKEKEKVGKKKDDDDDDDEEKNQKWKKTEEALIHSDIIMDSIIFDDIFLSVKDDAEAYENRDDKKKLEAAVKKSFQYILKANKTDADFILNKNMKSILSAVLSGWK